MYTETVSHLNLSDMEKSNVQFMTIEAFKLLIGVTSAKCLVSPVTGKLFLACDNGDNYKVEQDIDPEQEMKVLVPGEDISEACLVNVKTTATVKFEI